MNSPRLVSPHAGQEVVTLAVKLRSGLSVFLTTSQVPHMVFMFQTGEMATVRLGSDD